MLNYLSQSFIIHLSAVFVLSHFWVTEKQNPSPTPIELNIAIVEQKIQKSKNLAKNKTYAKSLISRRSQIGNHKVNITDYALRLKSLIDPMWLEYVESHVPPFKRVYTTILLININEYGKILNMRVLKSSGDSVFDETVLNCIKGAGDLPDQPPESVLTSGIEWSFSNGI